MRKFHFLQGLGNAAIHAADRWWEKEKARGEAEKANSIVDSNRIAQAAMEREMTGGTE